MPQTHAEIAKGLGGSKVNTHATIAAELGGTQSEDSSPTISSEVGGVMSGFNKGLATTLGLPVDLVAGFLGIEKPAGGSESFRSLMPSPITPQTATGKFAGRVAEEIGGTLPAVAGTVGVLPTLQKAYPLSQALRELTATSPYKLAAAETWLASLSGSGAATAQQIAPDSTVAELLGQLVGGLGIPGTHALVRRLMQRYTNPTRAVGESLANIRSKAPEIEANYTRTKELEAAVPGYHATTAQATGDPNLQALESEIARRDPTYLDRLQRRYFENNKAAAALKAKDLAIKKGATPQEMQVVFQRRVDFVRSPLEAKYAQATQDFEAYTKTVGSGKSHEELTSALMQKVQDVEGAARVEKTLLYNSIDPQNTVQVDVSPMLGLKNSIVKDADLIEENKNIPGIVRRLSVWEPEEVVSPILTPSGRPATTTSEPPIQPLSELVTLEQEVNSAIRTLNAIPTATFAQKQQNRRLKELKTGLNKFLDEIQAQSPLESDAVGRLKLARAFMRDYAERFYQGQTATLLQRGKAGALLKTPSSSIMALYLKSNRGQGAMEAAQDLRRIFRPTTQENVQDAIKAVGGVDAAEDAVLDYARNELAGLADLKTGKPIANPARMAKWLREHDRGLKQFPRAHQALRKLVGDGFQRQRLVKDSDAVLKFTQAELDKNAASLFLGDNVEAAIDKLMATKTPDVVVKQLKHIGGGDWLNIRRGIVEAMYDKAFNEAAASQGFSLPEAPAFDPVALRQFKTKYAQVLDKLWSPAESKLMQVIQQVSDNAVRGAQATKPITRTDDIAGAKAMENTVRHLLSRMWGVARNVVGPYYTISDLAVSNLSEFIQSMSSKQAAEMLRSVMLDPDMARHVQLLAIRGDSPPILKPLRAFLINTPKED